MPGLSSGSPSSQAELDEDWLTAFLQTSRPADEPLESELEFETLLGKHDGMYQMYLKAGRQINSFKRYQRLAFSSSPGLT